MNAKKAPKGRADAPALPAISPAAIDAIMDLLATERNAMFRPPRKEAAILALCVELHNLGHPFPERQTVADHIARHTDGACSKFTVDKTIVKATSDGLITQEIEIRPGNVKAHDSITRHRHYRPIRRLVKLVEDAKEQDRPRR